MLYPLQKAALTAQGKGEKWSCLTLVTQEKITLGFKLLHFAAARICEIWQWLFVRNNLYWSHCTVKVISIELLLVVRKIVTGNGCGTLHIYILHKEITLTEKKRHWIRARFIEHETTCHGSVFVLQTVPFITPVSLFLVQKAVKSEEEEKGRFRGRESKQGVIHYQYQYIYINPLQPLD